MTTIKEMRIGTVQFSHHTINHIWFRADTNIGPFYFPVPVEALKEFTFESSECEVFERWIDEELARQNAFIREGVIK